jgi:diguanylate cyclase (GGDEF)-like protein/PAS domain S-box-containing protein
MLNQELLNERDQETRLEFAWSGNLGHWYWNIRANQVTFNPLKLTTLGYSLSEIPEHISYRFFTEKLHPDDYKRTMEAMYDHLYGRADVYEVEYRIQTVDGGYKWFYDRGRITQFDEHGKPLFLAGIVFDITEKKETQLELEQKNRILAEMSETDGLTQIGNHRSLIEHLKAEMVDADRTAAPLCIALFDIDNFKKVNDTKGHVIGDQVLVALAAILKKTVRGTDYIGRYGGEEFMVIFRDTGLSIAEKVSERIRLAVESYDFVEGLRVTISGGVSQFRGETMTEFIHFADLKLYTAKTNGKNQIISAIDSAVHV